ncbi:MAG: MltA domain-containing protein [Proteobacteria bacterium]|nr:MltA domain-containing protein [Pseudomonadota bacterium]MBU1686975.1 MltA domain-containing protein [Pseudomonadota bacterium]
MATECFGPVVSIEQVLPGLTDELGLVRLDEAIGFSLAGMEKISANRKFQLCGRGYSSTELIKQLRAFREILWGPGTSLTKMERLREEFEVCGASGISGDGTVFLTGYFEPLVEGSLVREAPFLYPLYQVPVDLVRRDGVIGRLVEGGLVPYWTRAEIEEQGVLAGTELVYLDDPVEAFILQVQGSGRVRLRDGTIRRIQFGAKNGHPYRSIGKYLVDQGSMTLEEVTLPSLITYLNNNKAQQDIIMRFNESFVFFLWGEDEISGPLGSLGVPLTPGRSVALDNECYPPGIPAILSWRGPKSSDVSEKSFPVTRFVVHQDSGSAIVGSGRLDLFWGGGQDARDNAGRMKETGRLYFLVEKSKK